MPEFPSDSRENGFSDWIKAKSWSGGERFREAWKHYANVVQLNGPAGSILNAIDSACHGLPASGGAAAQQLRKSGFDGQVISRESRLPFGRC